MSEPYRRIEVELLASGQPRPYADHQRIYRVTVEEYRYVEGDEDWVVRGEVKGKKLIRAFRPMENEDWLIPIARGTVEQVPTKEENPERGWWSRYTDYAKVVAPGVVEIRIVEPYTD